ncbi:hypothetical protein [Pontixanthobacter sp.]|uniref:hypothetical protein n=1 Tax=Pontixanthobacter sp. TaxID=2792078 RepID=UPI003C7A20A9
MKQYPSRLAPTPSPQRRIPSFYAVPGKARADGWTPLRQAEFIGHLAETRSVSLAAQHVGMARETAYRLRRREWAESFCAAWDAAAGHAIESIFKSHTASAKVTVAELEWRIASGRWQIILHRGRYAGVRRKADNFALLQLSQALGMASRRGANAATPSRKSRP